jgi:hypothetical protein
MIADERYQLDETGTGNLKWSWLAGRILGLDLIWLANQLRNAKTTSPLARLFLGWVDCQLEWSADCLRQLPAPLSLERLHSEAFGWGSDPEHDGSLRPYLDSTELEEFAHREKLLEMTLALEWASSPHKL